MAVEILIRLTTAKEKEKLGCDVGNEIYVRKIDIGNSPDAISLVDIKTAGTRDPTYQAILKDLIAGVKPSDKIPTGFKRVWQQLSIIDGLLHKGSKVVLPQVQMYPGGDSMRSRAMDIAHEGHPGIETMKQFLRARLWYPGMDNAVDELCSSCLPCQASTEVKHRDPLIPSVAPTAPWEKLATDHWGPTADGKYLLVVIDKLSRYPEVAVVNSTSAEDNIEAFDEIFTRHGYCKDLVSDKGPPFNGTDTHKLQQYFKWAGINHHPTKSADDPEANGLAEAFMKHCQKIWHTAIIERKNPKAEINKHLLMVRSTPHPTTKKSPAELLFGRNINTRLPISNTATIERPDIAEAIVEDEKAKAKQKQYKDSKSYVRKHNISVGDKVLLKQKKQKHVPPHDHEHYTVTEIRGHQVTAVRGHQEKTRDAQKWKRVSTRPPTDYRKIRHEEAQHKIRAERDDPLHIDARAGQSCPTANTATPPVTLAHRQQVVEAQEPHPPNPPTPTAPNPPRVTRARNVPSWHDDYEM